MGSVPNLFRSEENERNSAYPCMSEYFADKTIAMTGGTGFLGQALIEKLLRCCPRIKKIILLIRNKKDVEPEQRLDDLINSCAFDILRKLQPDFARKLSFVPCALESDDLGLDSESKHLLISEVNVFIHSAASLRFNEHLRLSYKLNVKCVSKLLKLCKRMKHLQSLAHISTAYSHCDRIDIGEEFYDCGIDYVDLESSLKWMSDEIIKKVTPDILGKRPNTYTLTKALAEDVIRRESGQLPVCIVRPSMIVSAMKEPHPGWCNNAYGPTAFLLSYQKGVMRSVIADTGVNSDIIPVDIVVNAVITAAMKTGCDFIERRSSIGYQSDLESSSSGVDSSSDADVSSDLCTSIRSPILPRASNKHSVQIYNVNTSTTNCLTLANYVYWAKHWCQIYPTTPLRVPRLLVTTNRPLHNIVTFLAQTAPCYAIDFGRVILNKEPKMVRLNQKILAGMEVMEFFFTHKFNWANENASLLHASLHPKDKEIFSFDPRLIDWPEFYKIYMIGARKYILKEDTDDYESSRKALRKLKMISNCVKGATLFGACSLAATFGAPEGFWEMATTLWEDMPLQIA